MDQATLIINSHFHLFANLGLHSLNICDTRLSLTSEILIYRFTHLYISSMNGSFYKLLSS